MKLSSLLLESFKSYSHLELPLGSPRALIVGVNAVGKSSIREALKFVFTGRCQGTDERGSGADRLVPTFNGHNNAHVIAVVDDIGPIERTWTPTGVQFRVADGKGSASTQQQALLDRLKTSPAFLDAVLDSSVFLRLHHGDAKSLVLRLLDVRIELGEGEKAQTYTLEELEQVYQTAYEARRDLKRRLQAVRIPAPPPAQEHGKPEDIQKVLTQRRGELEAAVKAAAGGTGRRAQLEKRLSDRTTELARRESAPSSESFAADLEKVRAALRGVETVQPTEAPAPGDPARLTFLRGRVEALSRHDPKAGCVLLGDVECRTPALHFRKRAKELEIEADGMGSPALGAAVVDERAELDAELRSLEDSHGKARANEELIVSNRQEIDALKRELAGVEDTSAAEATVADLRARVTKGEGVLEAAKRYWQAVEAHTAAEQGVQALRNELAQAEAVVEAAGPSGARVQALADAMGTFETAVNSFTKPFGLTVQFVLDPEWAVVVNGRDVSTYSKSESYRIGIAIQLAVAALSGLSFAVVDEMDILDEANRQVLANLVFKAPLDQILVLGTREVGHALPRIPSFVCYRLGKDQEGRTVILEGAAA